MVALLIIFVLKRDGPRGARGLLGGKFLRSTTGVGSSDGQFL